MLTADTITDEQILELEKTGTISFVESNTALGFHGGFSIARAEARARCSEILNARNLQTWRVKCANLSQCLASAGMLEEAYRQGENIGWIKGRNEGWDVGWIQGRKAARNDRELATKI